MKIFITGGTGFIGRYILDRLRNHDILLLVHEPEEFSSDNINRIYGNLGDINRWKSDVKKFQPEACLHMAWEGIPDYGPESSIRNLGYGIELIKMLGEIGCKKFVSTGSCWEYGSERGMLKEDDAVRPKNAFSAAKNCLHWIGKEIAEKNGMIFVWTRLFYVYGPGQRPGSLIPSIIDCIKKGKQPDIKNPGNRNDFVYVEDVADALRLIVEKADKSTIYNIGSGESTRVKKVAEIIAGIYGKDIDIGEQGDSDFSADISRINGLGWSPRTGLEQGISKMAKR
ncbi:MAG: NAD-dependent epimerase/dehydratase [Nanoarchaeota archaeon]|nr:NAD-dependent epimerase/dehydratase [Nanoarchaeota archaeon]